MNRFPSFDLENRGFAFQGKKLGYTKTVGEYGIKENDTIKLTVKARRTKSIMPKKVVYEDIDLKPDEDNKGYSFGKKAFIGMFLLMVVSVIAYLIVMKLTGKKYLNEKQETDQQGKE